MKRGINKAIVCGDVGQDPEISYGQSGNAMAKLSVATSESWKDKDGNVQERTEWHSIRFYGKLAEIVGQYVKKGRRIYVEGQMRTDTYQDRETGQNRKAHYIVGDEMQLMDRPEGGGQEGQRRSGNGSGRQGQGQARGGESTRNYAPADQGPPPNDWDIPF